HETCCANRGRRERRRASPGLAANRRSTTTNMQRPSREQRLECPSRCLDRLPAANRALIIEYYRLEKGEQIANRTRLAEANGRPINALRLRVHRLRAKLERCVHDCLGRLSAGATSIRDSATRG